MVRMNDCQYNQGTCIQLSPFFHQVIFLSLSKFPSSPLCLFQVGGHSSMFQYDPDTICKLLEPPELDFYQSMPEQLKSYTPEFRGIVTVQYCEDKSGYINLVARPDTDDEELSTTTDQLSLDNNNSKRSVQFVFVEKSSDKYVFFFSVIRLRCSEDGHVDYSNNLGNDIVNYEQGKSVTSKINPWSLQLCKKQAEKFHRQFADDENVTITQSKFDEQFNPAISNHIHVLQNTFY